MRFGFFIWAITLLCAAPAQELRLGGANWERTGAAQQRLYYQEDERSAAVLWQLDIYDFFKTNSGSSGEIHEHYGRRQFRAAAALQQHRYLEVPIPPRGRLTHFDYRLWKNGVIIYEAKEKALARQIVDSLYHPQTGALRAVRLAIAHAEPRSVLEYYYRQEGLPLPYHLDPAGPLPVDTAVVALRVSSNAPLSLRCSDTAVKITEQEELGKLLYTLRWEGLSARSPAGGLPRYPAHLAQADFQNPLVEIYGRRTDSWAGLLQFIAAPLELAEYRRYHSLVAQNLSKQFALAGFGVQPVYFRDHPVRTLMQQEGYGGYLLSNRRRLTPYFKLEAHWERFLRQQRQRPIDSAVVALHRRVGEATARYMQQPGQPRFHWHSLVYTFYARLLSAYDIPYETVFLKAAHRPPFDPEWLSYRQFDALGLRYANEKGQERYLFPGLYAGLPVAAHAFPPHLPGAQIIAFSAHAEKIRLGRAPEAPATNRVLRRSHWHWQVAQGQMRQSDSLYFQGAFRSPVFHRYLLSDSARDVFTATPHDFRTAYQRRRAQVVMPRQQRRQHSDTLALSAPWRAARLSAHSLPTGGYLLLPFAASLEWELLLQADKALRVLPQTGERTFGRLARVQWQWAKHPRGAVLQASWQWLRREIGPEDAADYRAIEAFWRQPPLFNCIAYDP